MSDTSQGPGWWIASDGRWYPPELHPGRSADGMGRPPTDSGAAQHGAADSLAGWAPAMAPAWGTSTPSGPSAVPSGLPPMPGTPSYGGQPAGQPTWGRPTGAPTLAPPASAPGGRFRRGLRLVGVGFTMVRDEPGLMAVPVVAFLVELIIVGVGALVLLPGIRSAVKAASAASASGSGSASFASHVTPVDWLVLVAVGVLVTFVSVVSHATIIARVMARFHGERISNLRAAAAALTKSPHLLAWAFINYVVISILRSIGRRGIIGLLLGWLLRAGWLLASFFVVPVILFEDRGAVGGIKRSVELCRARWGENVIGNSAIGIIGVVAITVDVIVAALVGAAFAPLGAAVGAIGLVLTILVLTVASAAFNAALYWFAVTDQSPGPYAVDDLASAYRRRTRRSGASAF